VQVRACAGVPRHAMLPVVWRGGHPSALCGCCRSTQWANTHTHTHTHTLQHLLCMHPPRALAHAHAHAAPLRAVLRRPWRKPRWA
jgi:hypothetical protein